MNSVFKKYKRRSLSFRLFFFFGVLIMVQNAEGQNRFEFEDTSYFHLDREEILQITEDLKTHSFDYTLYARRAEINYHLKNWRQSADDAERALDLNKNHIPSMMTGGKALYELGEYGTAAKLFTHAWRQNRKDGVPLVWRGICEEADDMAAIGYNDYVEAIKADSACAFAYYRMGLQWAASNDSIALELFTEAVRYDSTHPLYLNMLGCTYYDLKDFEKAKIDFNKAAEFSKNDPRYPDNVGLCWFALGKNDSAEAVFKKCNEKFPDFSLSYTHLADIYVSEKNDSLAFYFYSRAIDAATKSNSKKALKEAYRSRSRIKEKNKDYESAFIDLCMVTKLYPDDGMAYKERAVLQKEMHYYRGAIRDYRKAYKCGGDKGWGSYGLASLRSQRHRPWFVKMNFKAAINTDKNSALFYNGRGYAFLKRNRKNKALKDFNKSMQLNRNYAYPYNNRASVELKRKQSEKALNDIETSLKLDSTNAYAYYNRAVYRLMAKDTSGALKDLSTSVNLKNDFSDAYKSRMKVYNKLGNRKEYKSDSLIFDSIKTIEKNYWKIAKEKKDRIEKIKDSLRGRIYQTPFNPKAPYRTFAVKGKLLPFIPLAMGINISAGLEYSFLKNHSIGADYYFVVYSTPHEVYDTVTQQYTSGPRVWHHENAFFINYRWYPNFRKLRENHDITLYTGAFYRRGKVFYKYEQGYGTNIVSETEMHNSVGILIGLLTKSSVTKDEERRSICFDLNLGFYYKQKDITTVRNINQIQITSFENPTNFGMRMGVNVYFWNKVGGKKKK